MWLRKFLTLAAVAGQQVITDNRRPLGYLAVALDATTAVGLTLTTPQAVAARVAGGCNYAIIQNPHATIYVRWRDDETDPTTSAGMRIPPGGELDYAGDLSKIKFIAESSTITLNVSVYA